MKSLRHFAEICSRGLTLKRRLPAQFGNRPIMVSPEIGGLRYWQFDASKYDPQLLQLAIDFISEGQVVWDIGANVGLFTFAAAHRVGPSGMVVCAEPDFDALQLLNKSRSLNADLNVHIVPAAVSDKVGVAVFNIAERARSTNFLNFAHGSTQTGGVRMQRTVMAVSLDFLLEHYPAPDFLKIDIEGAELYALKGGLQLLKAHKPIVFCETYQENYEQVHQLLVDCGYTDFSFEGENLLAR